MIDANPIASRNTICIVACLKSPCEVKSDMQLSRNRSRPTSTLPEENLLRTISPNMPRPGTSIGVSTSQVPSLKRAVSLRTVSIPCNSIPDRQAPSYPLYSTPARLRVKSAFGTRRINRYSTSKIPAFSFPRH